MKTLYILSLILLGLCFNVSADSKTFSVSGKVMDASGETLPGSSIYIKNEPGIGVVTDIDGNFTIKNISKNSILVFTYVGYKDYEMLVTKDLIKQKIILKEDQEKLDEVVVVGHGVQRKVSVVGAITTVEPKDLISPATSVTNMLGGRVPGIIAVTRSGEPGSDFSEFWIRGISTFGAGAGALVLIDGIEGNLDDIDPSDIESFSILKDASATAVYGVRGANGVVLVTTKKGEAGKIRITAKTSFTLSHSPKEQPEFVRASEYAQLANEARIIRGEEPIYSETELDMYKYALDPDLYPDVDWRDITLKDITWYDQHYFSASGGGATARYFLSAGVTNKSAIYKTDEDLNKYNTNVKWNKYTFRSNVTADLTKTTQITMALDGTIVKENAPGWGSTNDIWRSQNNLTPGTVPLMYSNGMVPSYGRDGDQISPYVLLNMSGYESDQRNSMKISFGATQNFSDLVKGLSMGALFSFSSDSYHKVSRKKMPETHLASGRYTDGSLIVEQMVSEENLSFSKSAGTDRNYYFESRLNYDRSFGSHRVGGLVHYYMEDYQTSEASDEIASIPKRYQALSARATYSFEDTYFLEANIGYTGSENFKAGEQFGVFPSIAIGWVPTSHSFVQDHLAFLSHLKFRASYGEVGNDRIGGRRFAYQTYVDENDSGKWGPNGLTEGQVGADNLRWEVARKFNFGIDATLLDDKFSFTVDFFKDIRDGIYQERVLMPEEVGVVSRPFINVGKMNSSGIDGSLTYSQSLSEHAYMTLRGNFTYSKNEVEHWDQAHPKYPYESLSGVPYNVARGLVSMGLFRDSTEIMSAPKQMYGNVRPGDIRYKDVNGDGKIDDDDIIPLSYSAVPEFQYGFAGEFTYKKWTFSIFFEGVSRVEYFLGDNGYYPFMWGEQGNILTQAADQSNRWTPAWYSGDPATENPNARFPRMMHGGARDNNNNRESTHWLADASYIRLKNVDVSYRWENKLFSRVGLQYVTLQLVGHNLKCWDKIDIGDAGQASSNGTAYPLQKTYTFQVSLGF